jgi:hypothetical protein
VAARCGRKRAKPGRQNPSAIDRHPAARFNQKIEPGGGCCGRRKSGQAARRPEQSGPAKRNTACHASVAGKKNREHRRRPAARFGRKPRANPSALKTSPKMKPGRALTTSGRPTHEHARMYLLQGRKSGQRSWQTKRTEIKAMNTRRKISDLVPTQNKMQTRNISLRSKQSSHPIHGGLRSPSLFLIGTKIGSLLI